ncbi:anhydro-N-acetylmuramic acid kinase [Candidatus Vondammii sp. HM_W22]|uniref:anhydro-N-acetylmuramic acid kinase n=1 Tax=Candidatus Vondammii sp. HM_W22 TaxID=2687299 RepID=UPI001F1301C8|nr:anhydro-N-acetylmuramic acid kinase [Candidatus Vondammii sp. HM_W22]
MESTLYVGLMSGTSMDGIDAVLVQFRPNGINLLGHHSRPWPEALQERLRQLSRPGGNEIDRMGELDILVADGFADAALELLEQTNTRQDNVSAIGSHGQTIRHRPNAKHPFSLQIGDPNRIAERTRITVVADFRRRDIAAGGEGAPLVPAFHATVFHTPSEYRAILNIGGIANLTLLPGSSPAEITGFDTGPGNTLLDYWAYKHLNQPRDENGNWAASGEICEALLSTLLEDDYFQHPPPKSTGPEYFSSHWLEKATSSYRNLSHADIQATLTALTAETVCRALQRQAPECQRIIGCGGGIHNSELMRQLDQRFKGGVLETSDDHGIPPDQVEAIAFAWLARQTQLGAAGNLPSVTGASHPVPLGGIYSGRVSQTR